MTTLILDFPKVAQDHNVLGIVREHIPGISYTTSAVSRGTRPYGPVQRRGYPAKALKGDTRDTCRTGEDTHCELYLAQECYSLSPHQPSREGAQRDHQHQLSGEVTPDGYRKDDH